MHISVFLNIHSDRQEINVITFLFGCSRLKTVCPQKVNKVCRSDVKKDVFEIQQNSKPKCALYCTTLKHKNNYYSRMAKLGQFSEINYNAVNITHPTPTGVNNPWAACIIFLPISHQCRWPGSHNIRACKVLPVCRLVCLCPFTFVSSCCRIFSRDTCR